MTLDEHCNLLGRLVGHFQSLEYILRGFLQELPSARPIGIPYGTDIYSLSVGAELPESEITSYDSLDDLIKKFNIEMKKQGLSTIDKKVLVDVRDALAHGRVSSSTPDDNMRLLKFDSPKNGCVHIVFNQQMDEAWFKAQITRVKQAILAITQLCPNKAELIRS